ncbi:unnamed protein product [Trichogramma brassicae]|uniref:Gustatory receptor n=1 Tax=Trichogramma brassicae TaxID=86971 RepID=A0A6H5IGN2_9HYME|nr:unnamed protein product [Trichogramma brassicae]
MRLLPRTVEKPLYLTYLVNWLCGIGVIEYPMGRPHPWLSFGYSGGCLVVYCTLAVLAAPELARCFPAEMLLPTTILFYSHILLTVSTIALGWLRSEGMRKCILNLAATDSLMDRFEATKNYSKVVPCRMLEIVARLAMVLFIMILSSYLFYEEDTPSRTRVLVSIVLSYPVMIMFVADTTFINIVKQVLLHLIILCLRLKMNSKRVQLRDLSIPEPERFARKYAVRVQRVPSLGQEQAIVRGEVHQVEHEHLGERQERPVEQHQTG